MKKTLLTFVAFFAVLLVFSQAVQRNQVVMEIGTGTGCQYCPGAAMGAHDLLQNGCQVAVIEYHSYNSGDPFNNPAAAARTSYYGITGYPTAFFDGTLSYVGGSNTQSLYTTYLPLYQQRYAVLSPLTIEMTGTNVGNLYNINVTITKVAAITSTTLKAHLVLTESDIPYNWEGQTMINNTERLMVPDQNGTNINFTSGNTVVLNLSFTKDPTWVTNNCELIAFVQDNTTKECLNGAKKMLNALYLPLPTNFTAAPTTGCTPLTVNYTDQSTGATSWNWTFPGGTPATSTLQNPVVVYNTVGTFDATLNAANIAGNAAGFLTKTAFISTVTTPDAPTTPQGLAALCIDPANQTYTTTGAANTTGYVWELDPSTAGVLTSNGASCTIDWDNTFTGIAQLKVRGTNACGASPWTPFLNITISVLPAQAATPTGPTSLCMNAGSTNYSTTGAANATLYSWELLPAAAGGIFTNGTSVSVSWSPIFTGTATLKVKGLNGACDGAWSVPLSITVAPGPNGFNVTGGGTYCAAGGTGMPVGLNSSETGVSYTLFLNNTATTNILPGTGSALTFGNQMTGGNYTVQASTTSGSCTNLMNGSAVVSVDPQAPAVPGLPVGPTQVYSGTTPTSDYTTSGGTYATTYSWEVTPSAAGTMTGTTTTGTATWNQVWTGTATVKVKSVNTCGSSSYTSDYTVAVAAGHVGIQEKGISTLVSVFPNPAHGMVTLIPARTMMADVRIYNALGSKMIEKTSVSLSMNYQLDISGLKGGLYFIQINSEGTQQTIKLVVE
ncbi:MAG: T9SS type A sorting domain-containing protein [Bacteroidota bacterium]